MEFTLKTLPAFYIVGYPALMDHSQIPTLIPKLWDKLRETAPHIKHKNEVAKCIGFEFYPYDFVETKLFYYMPAYMVEDISDIPMLMCAKTVPANTYAVFTHRGPTNTIGQTFEKIYHEWLPNSNYEMCAPYDFEFYDERFKGMDPSSTLDIYLPVKEKQK